MFATYYPFVYRSSSAKLEGPSEVKRSTATVSSESKEPCTIACLKAQGQVPQLQCTKCLCLYHHECVGLDRVNTEYRTASNALGKEYTCEVLTALFIQLIMILNHFNICFIFRLRLV